MWWYEQHEIGSINQDEIDLPPFNYLHHHRLHDLVVRNDHIQSITHQEMMKTSPETMERMVNLFCTSQTTKLRIQEADMDKVCNASRELFASKSKDIFDEFHALKRNLAYRFVEVSQNNTSSQIILFAGCSTQIGQRFSAYNLLLSWPTRGKAFAIRLNFAEYLIICVSFIKDVLIAIDDKILFRWRDCRELSPVEEIHRNLRHPRLHWTVAGELWHVFEVLP